MFAPGIADAARFKFFAGSLENGLGADIAALRSSAGSFTCDLMRQLRPVVGANTPRLKIEKALAAVG